MKKVIALIVCCSLVTLAGCGSADETPAGVQVESIPADENVQADETKADEIKADGGEAEEVKADEAKADEVKADAEATQPESAKGGAITEDQALEAVRQYCIEANPDLEEMAGSDDYTIYWDVTTNDSGEIVVLYRSYTGAEIRYYVDPESGEAYTTELVPGIIDEEQRTDETLNIRDYM